MYALKYSFGLEENRVVVGRLCVVKSGLLEFVLCDGNLMYSLLDFDT
jgi:hypothetical protein